MRRALAVVLTCALSACADTTAGVRTQFFGSYPFSTTERRTAAAVAGSEGDWIRWTVDPGYPNGVAKIAEAHLRGALFHEFHHLVRGTARPNRTLIDRVVFEGMATAFERDFAGVSYPWADYPSEVTNWVDELLKLPPNANRGDWLSQRPDGGRWIDYKTGTYLVDVAMKRLNRSSADLVATPTDDILAAARGQ